VFESVLDIYGFATVQAGEVDQGYPCPGRPGEEPGTPAEEEAVASEDKIVTQILTLEHASPNEMKKNSRPD